MVRLAAPSAALLALMGCQMTGTNPLVAETCDVSLDGLAGSTWVMLDATDGTAEVPNPQARGRFVAKDGKLELQYTVLGMGDVYDYTCTRKEDQLACFQVIEQANAEALCRAFEADNAGSCTVAKLQEVLADSLDEDTYKAARRAAMKEADEAEKAGNWRTFVARNNNVGNKIQGRVYVRLDKKCRLRISDMYLGVYGGRAFEDSNPVGTNPFVPGEGEYLFEHCDDGRSVVDLAVAERLAPGDIPNERAFELNNEVHYHYYGETAVKAEPGCAYSMDFYAQWRPVKKGVDAPIVNGDVDWRARPLWTDGAAVKLVNPYDPRGVFTMVRYKKCGDGAKEIIDVACNAAKIIVPE